MADWIHFVFLYNWFFQFFLVSESKLAKVELSWSLPGSVMLFSLDLSFYLTTLINGLRVAGSESHALDSANDQDPS